MWGRLQVRFIDSKHKLCKTARYLYLLPQLYTWQAKQQVSFSVNAVDLHCLLCLEKRAFNKPNTNQVDSVKEIKPVNKRPKRAAATKRKETNNDAGSDNDSDNDFQQQVNKEAGGKKDIVTSVDDMKPGRIAIPRPKGSPFADAVSPDVLQFMSELRENNHRDFMRLNEVTALYEDTLLLLLILILETMAFYSQGLYRLYWDGD